MFKTVPPFSIREKYEFFENFHEIENIYVYIYICNSVLVLKGLFEEEIIEIYIYINIRDENCIGRFNSDRILKERERKKGYRRNLSCKFFSESRMQARIISVITG